jgi:hypothetical protein
VSISSEPEGLVHRTLGACMPLGNSLQLARAGRTTPTESSANGLQYPRHSAWAVRTSPTGSETWQRKQASRYTWQKAKPRNLCFWADVVKTCQGYPISVRRSSAEDRAVRGSSPRWAPTAGPPHILLATEPRDREARTGLEPASALLAAIGGGRVAQVPRSRQKGPSVPAKMRQIRRSTQMSAATSVPAASSRRIVHKDCRAEHRR